MHDSVGHLVVSNKPTRGSDSAEYRVRVKHQNNVKKTGGPASTELVNLAPYALGSKFTCRLASMRRA